MNTIFESYYLVVSVNSSDEIFIKHKKSNITLRIGNHRNDKISLSFESKTISIPTSFNGLPGFLFGKR